MRLSPPDASEDRIVQLLQAGDPEGLRLLLLAYGRRVKSWLHKEFGDVLLDIEADEALNQAAFAVWQARERYDRNRASLRAWFYVIARRAALQVIRREVRARGGAERQDMDRMTSLVRAAGEAAIDVPRVRYDDGFLAALYEGIEQLPRMQRAIIEADLASPDVADATDLAAAFATTTNSIYVSRSIARKALKRHLTACGYAGPELRRSGPEVVR